MVAQVLNAHSGRKLNSKAAFRSIDTCESGVINDYMLEKYIRRYLVRGREKHEYTVSRRQDIVGGIVIEAMKMLHSVTASGAATVSEVLVAVGDQVAGGQELIRLTSDTE